MTDPFQTDTTRNFPEDYDQENGNYINTCHDCNLSFRGNKHRIWCKMCEQPNWEELAKIQRPDGPTVIPGAWLQGEMVGYSRCMVKKVKPLIEEIETLRAELERVKEEKGQMHNRILAQFERDFGSIHHEVKMDAYTLSGFVRVAISKPPQP